MYHNQVPQPRPQTNPQPAPFGNAFYGAGSGLIRGGLGAYGERILGSSSEYVQSNISRYFSDPQYYFQVNDQYVRNKLKIVLFPFLHRGHWTRITEPVGGRLSYKPPVYDINAPDLYIPFMAFGTFLVLAGLSLGLHGKFRPEALNWLFIKGLVGWFLQVALLKLSLLSMRCGEAPLLDIVAYAGYTFTGMCLAVLGRIVWSYSYYFLVPFSCLCMGIFLVKTMKRVLFAEARSYDSSLRGNHPDKTTWNCSSPAHVMISTLHLHKAGRLVVLCRAAHARLTDTFAYSCGPKALRENWLEGLWWPESLVGPDDQTGGLKTQMDE